MEVLYSLITVVCLFNISKSNRTKTKFLYDTLWSCQTDQWVHSVENLSSKKSFHGIHSVHIHSSVRTENHAPRILWCQIQIWTWQFTNKKRYWMKFHGQHILPIANKIQYTWFQLFWIYNEKRIRRAINFSLGNLSYHHYNQSVVKSFDYHLKI